MNEKWYVAAKKADFQGIAKRFGIDPVTARIIRNRDVVGDDEIRQYLYGTRAELGDPAQLQGGLEAASLLKQKIEAGKKIRIIGDYDIDGVNSTYILYRALTRCGAQVDYEIPDRMKDGYGLNISLLKLALEEGIDTVLTCDNGISAIAEIAYAKENGMTVIVTDHRYLRRYQKRIRRRQYSRRRIQRGGFHPRMGHASSAFRLQMCLSIQSSQIAGTRTKSCAGRLSRGRLSAFCIASMGWKRRRSSSFSLWALRRSGMSWSWTERTEFS